MPQGFAYLPLNLWPLDHNTWPYCVCVCACLSALRRCVLVADEGQKKPSGLHHLLYFQVRVHSLCMHACVCVCVLMFLTQLPCPPAAVCLKAQLCVYTPWMTSGGPSWGPLLTKRGPTISGSHSREKFLILAQEWYVCNSQDPSVECCEEQ